MSDSALSRHMKYHPCCKQRTKKPVTHPIINRELIVEALPLDIQARILLVFGDNVPMTHPYPRPFESLFEEQTLNQIGQQEIDDEMNELMSENSKDTVSTENTNTSVISFDLNDNYDNIVDGNKII